MKACSTLRNPIHDVGEVELSANGSLYILIACKSHQGIADANVEINIGERLNPEVRKGKFRVHLGSELEEEPKLTYLYGLRHYVHAKEVVQNYALVYKVASVRMLCDASKGGVKVAIFSGVGTTLNVVPVTCKRLHPVQTRFV